MSRIGWCSIALFTLAACGGSSKASLGKYGEECTAAMSCAQGLSCTNSVCTLACQSQVQCQAFSNTATCTNGYCYEPCHDKTNCPNGLDCVQVTATQGICKPLLTR